MYVVITNPLNTYVVQWMALGSPVPVLVLANAPRSTFGNVKSLQNVCMDC